MIDTPNLTILDLRFSTVVRSSLLCSIAPVTRERGNKGVKKKEKQGRYSPLLSTPAFFRSFYWKKTERYDPSGSN